MRSPSAARAGRFMLGGLWLRWRSSVGGLWVVFSEAVWHNDAHRGGLCSTNCLQLFCWTLRYFSPRWRGDLGFTSLTGECTSLLRSLLVVLYACSVTASKIGR